MQVVVDGLNCAAVFKKGMSVGSSAYWPESYDFLVDLENSLYLGKEPNIAAIKSLRRGGYGHMADKLLLTCQRDLNNCLSINRSAANYWTNIFLVIQLSILAGWFLTLDKRKGHDNKSKPIFDGVSDIIKSIIAEGVKAENFEKGLLNELRGDAGLLGGDGRKAADSYKVAVMYYDTYTPEEQEQFVVYPELEPLFLQYDLIWRERPIAGFHDSYDFVRDCSRRAEAKLSYGLMLAANDTDTV